MSFSKPVNTTCKHCLVKKYVKENDRIEEVPLDLQTRNKFAKHYELKHSNKIRRTYGRKQYRSEVK